ncbi:hypothetical protein EMPS_03126 [Entomortierella parvispora]|uniref:L-lactate dehydrogenase n=1 Tax=Entomortierella parvispora TaxID=205924 RepID=A0A9P3H5Z6_9FUNG|nr:hypothetical protein EMPS_03126 [Entomortierella parvispora]
MNNMRPSAFNSPKVAIIGTGLVGTSVAFACLMRSVASDFILYDIDESFAEGQTLDLEDSAFFSSAKIVTAVSDPYSNADGPGVPNRASALKVPISAVGQADIIVMTAGYRQAPGESRDKLLERNENVLKDVLSKIQPIKQSAILIMVTNPVNIMTFMAQKLSGLPANQVFGSGTTLDTARFRGAIQKALVRKNYSHSSASSCSSDDGAYESDEEDSIGAVDENCINAFIVGDHGDKQVAVWSSATIAGQALTEFPELESKVTQSNIAHQTAHRIYEIVDRKIASGFGIGAIVSELISAIIFDKKIVAPLSVYSERYDACLALPTVLGARGIGRTIHPKLSDQEELAMQEYVRANQEACKHYRKSNMMKRPAETQLVKEQLAREQ